VPRYLLLSTLTTEGRRTLHQYPERVGEVNKEIVAFGCTVVDQYALLGPYDFATIIEAPDNETVAHLSVDLGSRGSVNLLTLPALPLGDFLAKLEGSEHLGRGQSVSTSEVTAATPGEDFGGKSPHL
jgi:uncharacterized protein with GYD domain